MIKLALKIQPLFGPFFQAFLQPTFDGFPQCLFLLFLFGWATLLILVRVFELLVALFYEIELFLGLS